MMDAIERVFRVVPRRPSEAESAWITEAFLNRLIAERFPEPEEFHRWCLLELLKGRTVEEVGKDLAAMFLGEVQPSDLGVGLPGVQESQPGIRNGTRGTPG